MDNVVPSATTFDYNDSSLWALVPVQVREMEVYIGRSSAIALCMALGGERFRIPAHINHNQKGNENFKRLSKAIGKDEAHNLCVIYGGEELSIPKLNSVFNELRRRSIKQFVDEKLAGGASCQAAINEAARVFRMTSRAIHNNLAREGSCSPSLRKPT